MPSLPGSSAGDFRKAPRWALWVKQNPWIRTGLTSVFVLFMLAAAHLFMVAINAAEAAIEAPSPAAGAPARIFTDRPLVEELERALPRAHGEADAAALQEALVLTRAGEAIALRTLPVTPFLVWTALGLSALGVFLIWMTTLFKSDAAQTIVGIFGGNLLWTGGIEYGLTFAARSLGIGKSIGVVDGELVAIYGEYVLLKHTWGALFLVVAYIAFLPSVRCPIFVWPRQLMPLMRGPAVSGRIFNYGPRSAFQYATTCWAFYLLLLWAYDEQVFGVYSLATQLILAASVAGSVYCVVRLHKQTGWGPATRWAVAAMIVVWTPIEIFAKWGVLKEPWLLLEPGTATLFFGGLAVGTFALWRAQIRRRRQEDAEAVVDEGLAPKARCPFPHEAFAGVESSETEDGTAIA
jgi:hypothetical protein